jgi:hypothetical protein
MRLLCACPREETSCASPQTPRMLTMLKMIFEERTRILCGPLL